MGELGWGLMNGAGGAPEEEVRPEPRSVESGLPPHSSWVWSTDTGGCGIPIASLEAVVGEAEKAGDASSLLQRDVHLCQKTKTAGKLDFCDFKLVKQF